VPRRAELLGPGEIFLGFELYLLGREAVPGIIAATDEQEELR
jgi:hypothetical protein